jgi:hypothetical protein
LDFINPYHRTRHAARYNPERAKDLANRADSPRLSWGRGNLPFSEVGSSYEIVENSRPRPYFAGEDDLLHNLWKANKNWIGKGLSQWFQVSLQYNKLNTFS